MTETDATKKPLQMPPQFLPYLEKNMMHSLFKDMLSDLVIHRPEDHLQHIRQFLLNQTKGAKEAYKIILLFEPDLAVDKEAIMKILIKDLFCVAITRPVIMQEYEKKYGGVSCVTPMRMAHVLKDISSIDPVNRLGWILMDHPCTLTEARCMQRLGIIPSITLYISSRPESEVVLKPKPPLEAPRGFYEQDIPMLKFCFSSTRKDLLIDETNSSEKIGSVCFSAISTCLAGMQCVGKSIYAEGAPSVYRVVLIGCRGSGRNSQAVALAERFGLVVVRMTQLIGSAKLWNDPIGVTLRKHGKSEKLVFDILNRRLLQKDCLDKGWVLTEFSLVADDFNLLHKLTTPPNRVIFLSIDFPTARSRLLRRGYSWFTGKEGDLNDAPRTCTLLKHPFDTAEAVDRQLDRFFSETLPELRESTVMYSVDVDASQAPEQVQANIRAVVLANSSLLFCFGRKICEVVRPSTS